MAVTPTNENWGRWGARAELQSMSLSDQARIDCMVYSVYTDLGEGDGTFTRLETLSRMTCAIFGPNLPRELGPMCKVYMKQLDEQLTTSMKNHELQTPNTLSWPNPLAYVEECLKIVASRMESGMSIEDFVQRNMTHLMLLMEEGPGAARLAPNPEHNPVLNTDYLKIAHEWMLFCLEAWTMLDMTAICKNRHDLRLSDNFCKSLLKDTIESLLPRLIAKYTHHNSTAYTYSVGKANQIFPHEMTAEMLQELGGITFVWTHDITKHLYLDTKLKTVALFSHVAFAYLHAESGTDSSLKYYHLPSSVSIIKEPETDFHRLLLANPVSFPTTTYSLKSPNHIASFSARLSGLESSSTTSTPRVDPPDISTSSPCIAVSTVSSLSGSTASMTISWFSETGWWSYDHC